MKKEQDNWFSPPSQPDNFVGLNSFFNHHLDRLYCAKAHLVERLGEIEGQEDEPEMNDAIVATIRSTESELLSVESLYELIDYKYSFERCARMINFLNEYFIAVQKEPRHKPLRMLLFAAYLTYIRGVEQASLKLLQMSATKTGNKDVDGMVELCIKEIIYDNALLSLISNL